MTDRELMQQALSALTQASPSGWSMDSTKRHYGTIEALRARLAQPEQEPWGYISHKSWKMPVFVKADDLQAANLPYNNPDYTPVYKAPPQRGWQGLTEKDVVENALQDTFPAAFGRGAKWAEAKLREKNT